MGSLEAIRPVSPWLAASSNTTSTGFTSPRLSSAASIAPLSAARSRSLISVSKGQAGALFPA